jgi:hypothetical protein
VGEGHRERGIGFPSPLKRAKAKEDQKTYVLLDLKNP